jgi:hypothetical protein
LLQRKCSSCFAAVVVGGGVVVDGVGADGFGVAFVVGYFVSSVAADVDGAGFVGRLCC